MYGALISLLLLAGSSLSGVWAFPKGAPVGSCGRMIPGHGSNGPMVGPPPFWVTSDNLTYMAGQEITVTLQANETIFKGFLLQARDAETGEGPIGTFSLVTGSEGQLLSCTGEATAVTHTSRSEKKTVQAKWMPPAGAVRDIEFRATFVQSFRDFWVGVRSGRVMFTGVIPNSTLGGAPNSSPSLSYSLSLFLLPLMLLAFSSLH